MTALGRSTPPVIDPRPLPTVDTVIVGVGARSAGGLTALQVAMSARANKIRPLESHLIDKKGANIATVRLPSIGDSVVGLERLLALAVPAFAQAASPWLSAQRARGQPAPGIPVIVALPSEACPGFDPRMKQLLLAGLEARTQIAVDHEQSRLIFAGRGGGAAAFERAVADIRAGAEAIVVGGVDSYFDPDALEALDRDLRLHGPDTENGFIPGEGAGFAVLASRRRAASMHRYGQVISAAVENEPHPYGSEAPCLAQGVTLAVKRATEALGQDARRIPWVLTDVANERHRVTEWSYAFARTHLAFTPDVIHEQPLLKTGDLGAASAAVLLVMAAIRWQTRCDAGDAALIVTHSDGPERGAMVISNEVAV